MADNIHFNDFHINHIKNQLTQTMAKYIVGFLLMCSSLAQNVQSAQLRNGWMIPSGDMIEKENATIEIYCTKNNSDYTMNSLIFNISSSKPMSPSQLDKYFETIQINETTKVFRTNLAPIFDANIDCKLGKMGIDRVSVHVGTRPTPVSDFKCISANWENLTCSFERPYNPAIAKYKLSYSLDTKSSFNEPTNECPLNPNYQRRFNCEMKFDSPSPYRPSYEYYFFRLEATNKFGNRTEDFLINNYNIVVPDAPQKSGETNETSNSVVLNWNISAILTNFPRLFMYKIHYRSYYDKPDEWVELGPFNESSNGGKHTGMSHQLTNLPYAHAWYDYRVWLKVQGSADKPEMWSNFTSGSFQTAKRKPDNPPVTDIGAFSFTDSGHIYIYWKSLNESAYNGNNFDYSVNELNNVTFVPRYVEKTLAKFELIDASIMQKSLNFEIYSVNDMGKSEKSSKIRVPPNFERCGSPTNIKKIRVNSTTYNLSWVGPNHGPIITSYTVFWCESPNESPSNCKDSINFQRVDRSVTQFQLETNDTMNFAISANSDMSSSGMTWAMCTVVAGNEINKLTSIYMTKTASTYIEFKWSLACIDRSILTGYILEFCSFKDPKTEDCEGQWRNRSISANKTDYKLENLKPYTQYKTRVRMISDTQTNGNGSKIVYGPWSDLLVNTTLEDAPTPPMHLKVQHVTNSSVTLTWNTPETINGVLNRYIVSYNGHEKSVYKTDGTDAPYILNGLDSFQHYEVVVRACTVSCSIPSNKVQFKTGVGIPSRISQPRNPKDQDYLQWQPPAIPGGRLQYYELRVEIRSNDNRQQERIVRVNSTRCTFLQQFCENGRGKMYISVRAVNILHSAHADEHIHRMYGNDGGHVVKRDLAQKYIDVDLAQSKNTNSESNLSKRHSQPEIDDDLHRINANYRSEDELKQHDIYPTSTHVGYGKNGHSDMFDRICMEENDAELERYLASDKWPQILAGAWSEEWSTVCNSGNNGGLFFILIFLVIFITACVYVTFFAMKKLKKMKDISVELPAGLEDIREETKAKHMDMSVGINVHDDGVRSMNSIRDEQEEHLLHTRSTNSSESNSQCELNAGIDNSTEYHQHTDADDSVQTTSEHLDKNAPPTILLPVDTSAIASRKAFTLTTFKPLPPSPPFLQTETINESHRAPIIDNSCDRNAITSTPPASLTRPNPAPLTSNGYVTHAAIMGKPPVSSGYLPLSALSERKQTDDLKTKTPLQSTDIPGISGYVTHKQLSDFGQLMH